MRQRLLGYVPSIPGFPSVPRLPVPGFRFRRSGLRASYGLIVIHVFPFGKSTQVGSVFFETKGLGPKIDPGWGRFPFFSRFHSA